MEKRTVKTYGTIHKDGKMFILDTVPHVRARFKRMFLHTRQSHGLLRIPDTASNCQDLEMMLARWPHLDPDGHMPYVLATAERTRSDMEELDMVIAGEGIGPVDTILPLRDYQLKAVEVWRRKRRFLCGDALGLGKTCLGIGGFAAGFGPMVVVCQNHLTRQWERQFRKFLGDDIKIHAQLKGQGSLPPHDVLILPYTMLAKWADRLQGYRSVVFDEVQELRRDGTAKYNAGAALASGVEYVIGLSATPVINYGDEIFNVLDLIDKDCLGPRPEFYSEWCRSLNNGHQLVRDPVALGSFIAENHLFLRRTRKDVGKELPDILRVTVDVPFNESHLKVLESQTLQLARSVLSADTSFNEKGIAARQLDLVLRQQTGIMKAPAAAEVIADLVDSGERVLVTAWHREVYSVLQRCLRDRGIQSHLYSGTETPKQKDEAVAAFLDDRYKPGVLLMSIRSGAGLDGLQEKCSTIVHVELDWSGKIHEQATGRLGRDGQPHQVTEIFLVASGGSDPIVAGILGLKAEQSSGITDPLLANAPDIDSDGASASRGATLAREIMESLSNKTRA